MPEAHIAYTAAEKVYSTNRNTSAVDEPDDSNDSVVNFTQLQRPY